MGYLAISDALGTPIEIEGGLYHLFESLDFQELQYRELPISEKKSKIMRDYRLLPCEGGARGLFACDDAREYDAMRSIVDTCARLAALGGYGQIVSARKPQAGDFERLEGFELSEGGGFLRLDLSGCYWYKRYLFREVYRMKLANERGGRSGRGFFDQFLAPKSIFDNGPWSPVEDFDLDRDYPGGTFKFREGEVLRPDFQPYNRAPTVTDIGREMWEKLPGKSLEFRRDFLDFKDNGPGSDLEFWNASEMVVRSAGETPEEIAANIAAALLSLHTASVRSFFSFDVGYWLTASLGVAALWADFSLCVAKRPVTICKNCGAPIVENHPPRGVRRVYCSQRCRKADKRRERREGAGNLGGN